MRTAFLFAGQGAQYPGMGAGLAEASPAAAAVFAAADAARPGTREDCLSATAEELARTQTTQPTVLAVDLACARMLEEAGVRADAAAGFSLGEVGALAFAGVISDRIAFELIARRARLMDDVARENPGGMRAVLGTPESGLRELIEDQGLKGLELVNFNAPTQIVVAGPDTELEALGEALASAGGRSVALSVSGAFHSSALRPAAEGFAQVLSDLDFAPARLSVYANVTGEAYPCAADQAKALLARQISSPVQWVRTLENLAGDGITHFVEVGPGTVLAGLVRKTLPEAKVRSVGSADEVRAVAEELAGKEQAA